MQPQRFGPDTDKAIEICGSRCLQCGIRVKEDERARVELVPGIFGVVCPKCVPIWEKKIGPRPRGVSK